MDTERPVFTSSRPWMRAQRLAETSLCSPDRSLYSISVFSSPCGYPLTPSSISVWLSLSSLHNTRIVSFSLIPPSFTATYWAVIYSHTVNNIKIILIIISPNLNVSEVTGSQMICSLIWPVGNIAFNLCCQCIKKNWHGYPSVSMATFSPDSGKVSQWAEGRPRCVLTCHHMKIAADEAAARGRWRRTR